MNQFRLEKLDQYVFFIVSLSMDCVPFSMPLLQIGECPPDEGESLRVDAAVQRGEVLEYPDSEIGELDTRHETNVGFGPHGMSEEQAGSAGRGFVSK